MVINFCNNFIFYLLFTWTLLVLNLGKKCWNINSPNVTTTRLLKNLLRLYHQPVYLLFNQKNLQNWTLFLKKLTFIFVPTYWKLF